MNLATKSGINTIILLFCNKFSHADLLSLAPMKFATKSETTDCPLHFSNKTRNKKYPVVSTNVYSNIQSNKCLIVAKIATHLEMENSVLLFTH